ncbi:CbiQ family ECF transporter T component [Enterovirga rhinocerotis]|uniref:Biotin transport system permease protein n=1 Tax=Enterovirga rhinocerotis TaxID=1339210 RepID=A0A4R7BQ33_9HYPH|nr:CbiQ family ECF transporter T component [Enterovirga rhinocerotis]TDR87253.1 biotin transport system permease protein [Enterovirga rhinocerotis]
MSREAWSPSLRAAVSSWPAGLKLAALVVLATGLLLIQSAAVLGVASALVLLAGLLVLGPAGLSRAAGRWLVLTIGCLALLTLLIEGPERALVVLLRLSSLLVLAELVTGTTRASAIQDAIVAALRPFERLPFVSADKAGLALALALRSLALVRGMAEELREAQAARGLRASPSRLIIPLVARILREATETAEAIDARSWTGEKARSSPKEPPRDHP